MSSAVNPMNANDSTMPGDYESWSPSQPMVPPTRTPFPQLPPTSPTARLPTRTPFPRLPPGRPTAELSTRRPPIVPRVHHIRSRRHRRRPLTPEIVIERRPHGRSSWGRNRVITVPLDNRPTLGLRGPPKRVIEIERVRCHRRRRSPSIRYEYDYDGPPLPLSQQPIIVANPTANPFLSPAQQSFTVPVNNTAAAATSAFLSNLSQEMVDNLPKQTVHLPPIHLPGSQADANTELHTVTFPAEIINPVDGTLSIIQANPNANNAGGINIQPIPVAPAQPQLINIPTTVGIPVVPRGQPASPAMASDPLMNRFNELFQRLSIPQTQPILPAPNPPMIRPAPNLSMIRPTLPTMSQFDPRNNTVNNPPTISPPSTTNLGSYPSSNIQPTNPLNIGSYRPANILSSGSVSNMSYRPANITPSVPVSNMSYRPANITPSGPVSNMPYPPTNITPYRPANITPSGPVSNMPYPPTNITPYRPSTFTPSAQPNNATYRPYNTAPSNSSDIGPYQPANITPYANITNPSSNNPSAQSAFSSGSNAYTSAPSVASASSLTPFPRLSSLPSGPGSNSLNPSTSSLSFGPTPNQSINSTPKSILRNTSSIGLPNTTYTNLNSPIVMSSNDPVRKTARFT